MTRYLLDTNAVSDLINNRHGVDGRARENRAAGAVVGTSEIVVAELYFGVENCSTRDKNLTKLERALPYLKVWPVNRNVSKEFGRLCAMLNQMGRPIGPFDMLIAATALTLDAVVVSRDTDMLAVPGLAVENWAAS